MSYFINVLNAILNEIDKDSFPNSSSSLSTSSNSFNTLSIQVFIISYLKMFISNVLVPSSFSISLPV
jgi:hypothetical protein